MDGGLCVEQKAIEAKAANRGGTVDRAGLREVRATAL